MARIVSMRIRKSNGTDATANVHRLDITWARKAAAVRASKSPGVSAHAAEAAFRARAERPAEGRSAK
jgi:hypothetical protein